SFKIMGTIMRPKIKGSHFIMPFSLIAHLVTINLTLYLLTPQTYLNAISIISYNVVWLITYLGLNFYTIERKERFKTKFNKFLRHFLIFSLAYFAVFGFMRIDFNPQYQLFVLLFLFFLLIFYRWFFFAVRNLYRLEGGNFVNVVVIGKDRNYLPVVRTFKEPGFGYRFKGYFHNNQEKDATWLGKIENAYQYILNNKIDEVYCTVSQLSNNEIHQLI